MQDQNPPSTYARAKTTTKAKPHSQEWLYHDGGRYKSTAKAKAKKRRQKQRQQEKGKGCALGCEAVEGLEHFVGGAYDAGIRFVGALREDHVDEFGDDIDVGLLDVALLNR